MYDVFVIRKGKTVQGVQEDGVMHISQRSFSYPKRHFCHQKSLFREKRAIYNGGVGSFPFADTASASP